MPPAYSFGTSQRGQVKKANESGPGPGDYFAQKHHNRRPPTWRIGREQRGYTDLMQNPGPGQYDNSFVTVFKSFPQYQFGVKLGNHDVGKGITPGPGAYSNESKPILKSASLYKGGAEDALQEARNGPGPAAYETNYSTLYRPSSRIGTQTRGELYESQLKYVPGVGNYNVRPQTAGPFYGFGNSTRDQLLNKQTPGPGTYELQSTIKSGGKTMSIKHPPMPDDRENVPGPGAYEPYVEQIKRGNPKYRIGTAQRNRTNDSGPLVPGPGSYVAQSSDKRRPPSYKIGSESRGQIIDQSTPGPGAYQISRDVTTGKKYTLRLKPEQKPFDETPGPQDYYPEVSQTNIRPASCKVGTQRRDHLNSAVRDNPGPDQYNVAKDLGGPKYPFGSEARSGHLGDNYPGPGQYDIPPFFANNPEYLIPTYSKSQKSFSRTK